MLTQQLYCVLLMIRTHLIGRESRKNGFLADVSKAAEVTKCLRPVILLSGLEFVVGNLSKNFENLLF